MGCVFSLLPAVLGLSLIMATAQTGTHHMPTPPEPMDLQSRKTEQPQTATRRIDAARVQQEADDLARMAYTIPVDVASSGRACCPRM